MNKKGFTLTELLVVIVIMGIVSGLSIPLIRGVSQAFENKKYKTYVKAVLAAAKIYNDSYEEDLFGRKEYGCSYITYEKLEEKDLIKDIEIDNISCATNKTYVKVIKLGEKYGYSGFIGCGEEVVENGVTTVNVIDKHSKIPDDAVDTIDTTACTGSAENNISIKIDKSQVGNTFDKKKRSTKITLESGTGIDPNASLKYAWSTTPDGFGSATYNSVSFSSIASASNQETNLLRGISTTVTSSKIETPTETGTYYLLVRVDSLNDIYGGSWKNTLEVGKGKVVATSNNYISYGPFAIDNSAPTTPTVTGYKKTSSADVSSVEGLTTLATNTWYSGWAVVQATGSTDNSTVNYYYKATGATTNTDGFVKNSIRNVDAEGTSTLKFKACDLAGNCSSEVTFTVKLDRTAPSAPTVTGYKKTSATDVSSVSGLSTIASNTWYNGWIVVKATGSTDTNGVTYYYSATGATTNTDGFVTGDIRNVDAEGTSTIKFKTKDAAGNWSSEVTYTAKLDRTAPSAPTVTGYKKTSSADVTSVSGLNTIASNTWHGGWVVVKATGSTDTNGVTYYYSATGATTNTDGFVTGDIRNVNAEGTSTLKFKAKDPAGNWSSESTFVVKLDHTGPTVPTVTGYMKTSSADVSSTSGLSTIASGTCTDKFLYVVASGSSDSGGAGGVNYKMTVSGYPTGNSNNVEDVVQSTKNVNTAGTITVKYKACDSVGNCSDYTTFISKQDRTAPNAPTVTGYKKTSSDNVSSTSGLSSIATNTWTDKFLYVVASGSSDSGVCGGVNYKMTVSGYPTGNSNNVEDAAQSTKNVNSAGTITVKYKACDSVGNCSGYTTFTSKQDRTAPTATITAKSSSTWEYSQRSYTIKCSDASDASGVSAYYWGTTNPTALSNITTTTDLSSVKGTSGLTKNVTSNGTYYLGCRDAAGNFAKVSKTVDSKTCYKGTYGNPQYVNIYESSQGSTSCTGSGHWKYEFMNCSKGTDLWTVCNSGCDNTPGPRKNYVCCIKRKEDSVTCYSTN